MIGKIHSFQSLGTVDGPGVRYVVFMQGCPLRCKCCHNPDTWDFSGGKEFIPEQVLQKAVRFKEYFGKDGGITVSGGEPLMQSEFITQLFSLCHQKGINTCLDTAGCVINDSVKDLLKVTDRVLLDIKYTNDDEYNQNVGCSMSVVLDFLSLLDGMKVPTTIRQVIIPTVNDNEDNIKRLKEIANKHKCVDKIELLPFRKICQVKYDNMGIEFPFGSKKEPTSETMFKLNQLLK
ncbi:MAG: pyruvate formate lyase-activating protein [Clostridia bacterium]|nr:pyruvate formate lyase-activating protein [Clostridia bacterium]